MLSSVKLITAEARERVRERERDSVIILRNEGLDNIILTPREDRLKVRTAEVTLTVVEQVERIILGFLNAPDDCDAEISVAS